MRVLPAPDAVLPAPGAEVPADPSKGAAEGCAGLPEAESAEETSEEVRERRAARRAGASEARVKKATLLPPFGGEIGRARGWRGREREREASCWARANKATLLPPFCGESGRARGWRGRERTVNEEAGCWARAKKVLMLQRTYSLYCGGYRKSSLALLRRQPTAGRNSARPCPSSCTWDGSAGRWLAAAREHGLARNVVL
jgi:hypothetical protein